MSRVGPLLREAMHRIERGTPSRTAALVATIGGDEGSDRLPVVVKMKTLPPEESEGWGSYRHRVNEYLERIRILLAGVMKAEVRMLYCANALSTSLSPDQIRMLYEQQRADYLELDPIRQVVKMDNAISDIELPLQQLNSPRLNGHGVTVAVLDSGIDTAHPYLRLAGSFATCQESIAIPGHHGTHCAGVIASNDSTYPGVAPGVALLNIKVLKANGMGVHSDIVAGIDKAIELGSNVISLSLGFNQLPSWSNDGHGWDCASGDCVLCTAVDNAVMADGVVVVAAAGNEHERANALRQNGLSNSVTTELTCPGHAREALTVGALTKVTYLPASFSSHGPTRYGLDKPDLAAPGVNITSLAPVPRDAHGAPVLQPARSSLFARMSGTSMATPIVAGVVALAIQRRMLGGQAWTPRAIRGDILGRGVLPVNASHFVVGRGRVTDRNI